MTIILATPAVAFAAFCVWLTVRVVNGQKPPGWSVKLGGALLFFCGIALAVWWWRGWSQSMHDMFTGNAGPVLLRSDWPRPLNDLLDDPDEVEINKLTIRIHCLCGGVWDSEFVWRMDIVPGLLELIEKRWQLAPVSGSDWGVLEGYNTTMTRERTPAWWTPRDDGQTSFYSSPEVHEMMNHFRVAVDEKQSTIWVHYRYRF